MFKISSPVLSPVNDRAVYQKNGQFMLLDDAFDQANVLLHNIDGASHLKWSHDGEYIAFILNGQLKVVTVATAFVVDSPLQNVSQFEWGTGTTLYVTANNGDLYEWLLQGQANCLLEQASIEAYHVAKEMAVIKRGHQLFAVQVREGKVGHLQEVTVQPGCYQQVAFSFTGQYVAYVGETDFERHLYVYDFDLGITQNLTEMLDVYAGDAMSPHTNDKQGIKEIQWIETDALYFLLSSDGDVRLYYADLYGSLFPASPESEHIVSYSVARNGNWALYVANQPFTQARLSWFDITMGEGRTIEEQPVSKLQQVESYYEIVEVASTAYYMWGYVPPQCEKALIILSGQGRMLGNGYEARIAKELSAENAVVLVNHPGALGYGVHYANAQFNEENEADIQQVVAKWLAQKTGRTIPLYTTRD